MSDDILRALLHASNTVVMERLSRGVFKVIGRMPEWFNPFCGDQEPSQLTFGPGSSLTFVENFLEDAEAFWQTHEHGELRSGPWSETTARGRTGRLEAVAYSLGAARVLTLTKLASSLRERRALLQRARENRLAFERLERAERSLRRTEEQNRALIAELEAQRSNLVAVLNQLREGTVLLDAEGRIVFLNRSCQRLFGLGEDQMLGRPWPRALPFPEATKAKIRAMLALPPSARGRIATGLDAGHDRHYWMEVDVQDDPRESGRHVLYFYDVSERQDLRRVIEKRQRALGILGESEPMRRVLREIDELGRLDTTVMIEGETGTGKELVARELHALSRRSGKPFVAVNCAGLTESLLTSQLFGHRKGAFTGAIANQQGVFEAAQGGTLFLDEIGDMPHVVQATLLRTLQEREITRLGDSTPRRIDVRVVAATHRDLPAEVASGRFRSDLLYRIRVARIHLPPLRERGDDLLMLSEAFLQEFREAISKPVEAFSPEALQRLRAYQWPGNVRELRSAVEFAVIRCRGATIQGDDLPPELCSDDWCGPGREGDTPCAPEDAPMNERERILLALDNAGGNRTAAARLLGVSRATLYRRLAEWGIQGEPEP